MTSIHYSHSRTGAAANTRNRAESPAPQKTTKYITPPPPPITTKHNVTLGQPLYPIYPLINRPSSSNRYSQTSVLPSNEYDIYGTYNRMSNQSTAYLASTSRLQQLNNKNYIDAYKPNGNSILPNKLTPTHTPSHTPTKLISNHNLSNKPAKHINTLIRLNSDTNGTKHLENHLNNLNLNNTGSNNGISTAISNGNISNINNSKNETTSFKKEPDYSSEYRQHTNPLKTVQTQYYVIQNSNISPSSTSSVSTTSSSSQSIRNSIIYNNPNENITSSQSSNTSSNNSSSNNGANIENGFLEHRGFVGLKNLGNTCFMNSILQCLSNTKFLLEYVLYDSYINDLNTTLSTMKGSLFKSYAALIKKMWKGNEICINPQDFRHQLIRYSPNFSGYAQQDAEEFLTYLIKGLHEDVNLVKTRPPPYIIDEKTWDKMNEFEKSEAHWALNFRTEKSRISDMFVGQLKSTLMCTKCDYRSPTFELFWDLAVPIPTKNPSIKLDDCIKLFMAEEILDGDNKPVCSSCKEKRRCAKRYTIEKLPKILVIHLKRFLRARYNNKINLNVDYPIEGLDMSKYLSCNVDPLSKPNRSNQNCVYDLYGISLHSGTESSGHYVAYCKNPFNHKWYCFNDQMVREIKYNALQDPNAYILFYQLRS